MKIIDVDWTPRYNILLIKCDCEGVFKHRADRRKVECPKCHKKEDCLELKKLG